MHHSGLDKVPAIAPNELLRKGEEIVMGDGIGGGRPDNMVRKGHDIFQCEWDRDKRTYAPKGIRPNAMPIVIVVVALLTIIVCVVLDLSGVF